MRLRISLTLAATAVVLSSCGIDKPVTLSGQRQPLPRVAAENKFISEVRSSSDDVFNDVLSDTEMLELGDGFCGELADGDSPDQVLRSIEAYIYGEDGNSDPEFADQMLNLAEQAFLNLCPQYL